jgi:GAF domain-containing protein
VQIHTAAEITRSIAKELDLARLLPTVCELIKSRFNLYYVGIFLIEPGSDQAVLRAGSGEAGQAMLAEGHRLQVGGDSMVGQATATRQARIALDVAKESSAIRLVRFANPHLPDTRSEMALPLISQQAVLGALSVQSEHESAFDEDDIVVLRGIADSLTSAIENARLFGQIQKNLEEISQLHSQYLRRSWMQIIASQGPQEHVFEAHSEGGRSAAGEDAPAAGRPYTLQVPILLREQMIGSLTLESVHALGEKERALIEAVINQAALTLENARLLEETRKRADQEIIAANISSKIWSSSNMDTILRTTLEELGVSLEANEGSIELWPDQLTGPQNRIEESLSRDRPRA